MARGYSASQCPTGLDVPPSLTCKASKFQESVVGKIPLSKSFNWLVERGVTNHVIFHVRIVYQTIMRVRIRLGWEIIFNARYRLGLTLFLESEMGCGLEKCPNQGNCRACRISLNQCRASGKTQKIDLKRWTFPTYGRGSLDVT